MRFSRKDGQMMLTGGALMAITILLVSTLVSNLNYHSDIYATGPDMEIAAHHRNLLYVMDETLSANYADRIDKGDSVPLAIDNGILLSNQQLGNIEARYGYLFHCSWDGNYTIGNRVSLVLYLHLSNTDVAYDTEYDCEL